MGDNVNAEGCPVRNRSADCEEVGEAGWGHSAVDRSPEKLLELEFGKDLVLPCRSCGTVVHLRPF